MRITSGVLRGRKILEVNDRRVRETLDIVRESLFNSLRGHIENKVFYDLFAGSGAVGIEALSCGASFAVFVDNNFKSIKTIIENLKSLNLIDKAKVIKKDVLRFLKGEKGSLPKGDFIFLDPPYEFGLGERALEIISISNIIKDETIIIYEHSKRESLKTSFEIVKSLKIGETILDFLIIRRGSTNG
ncbi:MAG: 16S rRNA (guanine(966)-N(2))-methyltransferase RsmD [Caldisericia bacterium]|jgi:16S rRNA (guanine(966)-N(2))-methyltransferase RsmD|nr:16S rRNA (guanine(966)-N(2))-methyltransferase RsmD [Caldisericia bacterium]